MAITHELNTNRRLHGHFDLWPAYTVHIEYQYIDNAIRIISATMHNQPDDTQFTLAESIHADIVRQYRDLLVDNAQQHIDQLKAEAAPCTTYT